nr:group II intron maturase-specific domain-containing protein [Desulfolutivibrio sulfoxidireducens]
MSATIATLTPKLRGWVNYIKLAEVKGVFEGLDEWLRRKLRCLLWGQWKRAYTRAKNLMRRGLTEERAWRSAITGTTASPGLFETMEVLGRDRVLSRMERALAL